MCCTTGSRLGESRIVWACTSSLLRRQPFQLDGGKLFWFKLITPTHAAGYLPFIILAIKGKKTTVALTYFWLVTIRKGMQKNNLGGTMNLSFKESIIFSGGCVLPTLKKIVNFVDRIALETELCHWRNHHGKRTEVPIGANKKR